MDRFYTKVLLDHIKQFDQMEFISGARQVGKTTLAKKIAELLPPSEYLNWDVLNDRELILAGEICPPRTLGSQKGTIVLDEIHKYKKWKNFIKGFYDKEKGNVNVLITGSAKLNIFRKGQDSLMGRYFLYRIHPISVAEYINPNKESTDTLYFNPVKIDDSNFEALLKFGGFPEPLSKQSEHFSRRWQRIRQEQLIQEEIRSLSQIEQLGQLEVLAEMIKRQSGQLINYSQLSKKVRVSVNTVIGWIKYLTELHYCFIVRPWSKNLSRAIIKEPKCYLTDWSVVEDVGAKNENFIACHLLKAVQYWTDRGLGDFGLYFIRTKEKEEVDFVVTKNGAPWFLVEAKTSCQKSISKSLIRFQKDTGALHAFQVAFDLPFVDEDCFKVTEPVIVPAKTFLSQLI